MIHRALMGSLERFMGILIEHYAGAFPLWLSPVQLSILTISDKHVKYGGEILDTLLKEGLRVTIDTDNEKVGYKIRRATIHKTPYMCIIGDNELTNNTVNIRKKNGDSMGEMSMENLMNLLKMEIEERR
jgi:threonyl-tRNA synthetase